VKPISLTVKPFAYTLVILAFLLPLSSLLASPGEAVPVSAQGVFTCVGQTITDTVLTGWLVSALIIVVIRLLLRGGPRVIPTHGQAFLEGILSALRSLIEPITGKRVSPMSFPC
jgi:F-type H+-transporting ATPase subunit a